MSKKLESLSGSNAPTCSRLIPTPTIEEMEDIDAAAYQEYRKMQRGAKGQIVTFVGSIGYCTIVETLKWANKTMGGPQGSGKSSVDHDRARPPLLHHDVI
jgi:hypothetical protein